MVGWRPWDPFQYPDDVLLEPIRRLIRSASSYHFNQKRKKEEEEVNHTGMRMDFSKECLDFRRALRSSRRVGSWV